MAWPYPNPGVGSRAGAWPGAVTLRRRLMGVWRLCYPAPIELNRHAAERMDVALDDDLCTGQAVVVPPAFIADFQTSIAQRDPVLGIALAIVRFQCNVEFNVRHK
jgi:hypothetical protein